MINHNENSTSQFPVPILFLIFNRPDTTDKVFQVLRRIKPALLFVSADGPRPGKKGEKELCDEARRIIDRVDWECDVKTNFIPENRGCKIAVSSGIDWFFEHVEEGIILEDDCLPDPSFFLFCKTMLELYRQDESIMHVGGTNFQDGISRSDGSYYFSGITHIWGWATWRSAWKNYDVTMSTFPHYKSNDQFTKLFPDKRTREFWAKNFSLVYNNQKDTWDIQWMFAVTIHSGTAVIPNKNLISNIGFASEATHTVNKTDIAANRPSEPAGDIVHPTNKTKNYAADIYTMNRFLNPNKLRKLWYLLTAR